MNYNERRGKYILSLGITSIYLSVFFVENTKLKEWINEDTLIIRQKLLDLFRQRDPLKSMLIKHQSANILLLILSALSTLNQFYSKENNNLPVNKNLFSYYRLDVPLSPELFDQILEKLYILFFLIDYLEVDKNLLLQNDGWINFITEIYNTILFASDNIKQLHSSLINDVMSHIEEYLHLLTPRLGQLLLKERQRYNIPPKRNILTKGPNDSTGLNLHNVLYSLRTDE